MPTLLEHLSHWKPFTALVVGDFMLDRLVFGDAERLSPDAPVPVLRVRRREQRAGGAANVCLDLSAMRGRVRAFGLVGDDDAGRSLRADLERAGVDAAGLVPDPTRPTTAKEYLIGYAQQRHPHKMFRVDEESREPIGAAAAARVIDAFERALPGADVVCLEDYAKGVCTPGVCRAVIERARAAGKPVFVDPALLDDYSKYRGATAITPNRIEARRAAGPDTSGADSPEHNERVARTLLDRLELDAAILTLDRHGALLVERAGGALAVPTLAREVYDVTGAGDMFLAGVAAARANGCSWPDAVRFANAAAGLEVEVYGVQPIPLEQIHHFLLTQSGGAGGKVRTVERLLVEVEARRRRGERIVFTNGCFDVIHAGHVWLLDQAKKEGDFLVVATNTDERIREYKGANRPVNRQEDRVRVLAGLAAVDAVVVFDEETPAALIDRIAPDVLVKGDEYTLEQIPGARSVQARGGRVVRVPMMPEQSTTRILQRADDPRASVVVSAGARARFVNDRDEGDARPA